MDLIDKVKDVPILDVAEALGIVVKKKKALCFTGHDKDPSLCFNPSKNFFHCFGCGIGGTNIELVVRVLGLNRKEAIIWLKDKFVIGYDYAARSHKGLSRKNDNSQLIKESSDSEVYMALMDELCLSDRGRIYLRGRGFSDATINTFSVKDCIDFKKIFVVLLEKYGELRLEKAGLVRTVEYNGKISKNFLWWDHTILFPFYKDGKVVYIQGRRISEEGPKYLGLKGVQKPLYNYDVVNRLKRGDSLLICEGIPDVLAAYENGYDAVGVLGAHSFNARWIDSLLQFNIIGVPDNDIAGNAFARKLKQSFADRGKCIHIFRLNKEKDLAEFYCNRRGK